MRKGKRGGGLGRGGTLYQKRPHNVQFLLKLYNIFSSIQKRPRQLVQGTVKNGLIAIYNPIKAHGDDGKNPIQISVLFVKSSKGTFAYENQLLD